MCKECGRQICPSACPEFDHFLAGIGKAESYCRLCGAAIYPSESHYRRDGITVCAECGDGITAVELSMLLGTDEVLVSCGFEKVC